MIATAKAAGVPALAMSARRAVLRSPAGRALLWRSPISARSMKTGCRPIWPARRPEEFDPWRWMPTRSRAHDQGGTAGCGGRDQDLAGDGDHYAATVVSAAFKGKTRVQQHQMVHAALQGLGVHAPSLTTSVSPKIERDHIRRALNPLQETRR